MHYFLHGMPLKERMNICMLLAMCVLAMALGKCFPDKSNGESDMEKRNTSAVFWIMKMQKNWLKS